MELEGAYQLNVRSRPSDVKQSLALIASGIDLRNSHTVDIARFRRHNIQNRPIDMPAKAASVAGVGSGLNDMPRYGHIYYQCKRTSHLRIRLCDSNNNTTTCRFHRYL